MPLKLETPKGTGPTIAKEQKSRMKRCLTKLQKNLPAVLKYNNYYNGKHDFNFSSEKFTTQFAKRLKDMRDNLCKTVVKAPADRLEVLGFGSDKKSTVYVDSWEIWKRSQMPRLAKRVHREAFKTGDGFVIVWAGTDGRARIVNQDSANCCVFYNPETNTVEFGAKAWRGLDDFFYLTVYTTTTIEKYISIKEHKSGSIPTNPDAFKIREVEGEPFPIAIPSSYGGVCPLFHFGLESSILDDVIPLNDALNKEFADLLISSESNSLRQRWSTGISYEVDPETGKQIIPFERASQWVASDNIAAKFGDFTDTPLEQFLKTIEDLRMEIASVSGVPHYYFRITSGDFPSGEALTKAESRFTSLISDAQLDFGETWAAAMKLAMRIDGKPIEGTADAESDNPAGEDPKKTTVELETQWKPAAPMSDNEKCDLALKKKQIGVSDERNLSEIGYTDAEIEKMKTENQAKQESAAKSFGKAFDGGGGPPLG